MFGAAMVYEMGEFVIHCKLMKRESKWVLLRCMLFRPSHHEYFYFYVDP